MSSGNHSRKDDRNSPLRISFNRVEDGHGIETIDPIDRHRYTLRSPTSVSLLAADTACFAFPVDAAVRVRTETITLPTVVPAYVRNQDGERLAEVGHSDRETLDSGAYSIELFAPIRLYLRMTEAVSIATETTRMRISFGAETEVTIGARSHRDRPAATITTTDDPADVMAAVSTFGSALRTTTAERSYPSYRGHPPVVERGEALDIPAGVTSPDTGVSIELPLEYRSIYVAAPLAYYLGVDLRVGAVPRLVTETGFEYPLDGSEGFERTVERVLKRAFLLDCVTRTEGGYPSDLHERRLVERHIDYDFATLYDLPPPDRIEAYLSVPFEALEEAIPEWKLTAHVEPTFETAEMLPFVVNDLAVVRTQRKQNAAPSHEQVTAIEEFLSVDGAMRGSGSATTGGESSPLQQIATDSLEQVWIGSGTPTNASKATTAAYRNRLGRKPTDGDIEVAIVCNEDSSFMTTADRVGMTDERDVIDDTYGSHRDLPFDVSVRRNLTSDELRSVLESSADFFHYIGHIDDDGFECTDGSLDAKTLESVGADAFLLNACQSYEQGMNLVRAGSVGGIATLSDVPNTGAVPIGTTLARLLNCGFPLRAALEIARDESLLGHQYIVVGDGGMAIAQAESGTPILCDVETTGESLKLRFESYPTTQLGMGSMFIPYTEGNEEYFLNSGRLGSFELSKDDLERVLNLENVPIRTEEGLRWSKTTDIEEIL